MNLSYTQCKQIAEINTDWRDVVEALNDQPEWIIEHLEVYDIQAINQGGCASGAYMPAVTYHTAQQTMAAHGDAILDYINDIYGTLPAIGDDSWSGYCCTMVSMAVELWCSRFDLENVNWD